MENLEDEKDSDILEISSDGINKIVQPVSVENETVEQEPEKTESEKQLDNVVEVITEKIKNKESNFNPLYLLAILGVIVVLVMWLNKDKKD